MLLIGLIILVKVFLMPLMEKESQVKGESVRSMLLEAQQRAALAEDEVAALRQQHSILRDMCEKEIAKNEQYKAQIAILKENHLAELNSTEQQRKKPLIKSQTEVETALSKEREVLQALREENAILSKSLTDSQQHAKQLERVIQFLRERGEESHLEAKQLRDEFQSSQSTITSLSQQLQITKEELLHAQERHKHSLHEMEVAHAELLKLRQEKHQHDETLNSVKGSNDDLELNLKLAQQHLTKKMKEASLLTERNEEQRIQILELQQAQS
jgi:hypothetical protein